MPGEDMRQHYDADGNSVTGPDDRCAVCRDALDEGQPAGNHPLEPGLDVCPDCRSKLIGYDSAGDWETSE
jgi:hypothetical protein